MTVYADLFATASSLRTCSAGTFRRNTRARCSGPLVAPQPARPARRLPGRLRADLPEHEHPPLPACTCSRASPAGSSSRSRCVGLAVDGRQRGADPEGSLSRQLVAFSMVATQAVTFGVMLVILIVLSLVFIPEGARDRVARDPAGRLFAGLVAGLALIVACLNVLFRDIEHILAAALLPWFFLTPILWSRGPPAAAKRHHALIEVLRWGNPITPPICAVGPRSGGAACRGGRRDLSRGRRRGRARARRGGLPAGRRPDCGRALAARFQRRMRRTGYRPS